MERENEKERKGRNKMTHEVTGKEVEERKGKGCGDSPRLVRTE